MVSHGRESEVRGDSTGGINKKKRGALLAEKTFRQKEHRQDQTCPELKTSIPKRDLEKEENRNGGKPGKRTREAAGQEIKMNR